LPWVPLLPNVEMRKRFNCSCRDHCK
jgi:hypothetical protein